jgi:hypothetical protein
LVAIYLYSKTKKFFLNKKKTTAFYLKEDEEKIKIIKRIKNKKIVEDLRIFFQLSA